MTPASTHFRFAVRSDRGLRSDNQDAAYADSRVLALADGMGGHPAGDVAASLVIRPFVSLEASTQAGDVVDHLRTAALGGDVAIAEHVAANPNLSGMGTTLTAVLLDRDRLGLLHVGDSRAYLLREGVLYQLSHDDTLVQSEVDQGLLSAADARSAPYRNVVLRALMVGTTRFSLANFEVVEGDRLLLCSDGISDYLTDDTLRAGLGGSDLDTCAERLVALALDKGSQDNLTCIVAEVASSGPESASASAGANAWG